MADASRPPVRMILGFALASLAAGGCTTPRVEPAPSEAVLAARARANASPPVACPAGGLAAVSPVVVGFPFGETALSEITRPALAAALAGLKCNPAAAVVVKPDADSHGTDAQQREVAARRGEAVRAYLVGQGIEPGRIRVLEFGAAEPAGEHLLIRAEGRRW